MASKELFLTDDELDTVIDLITNEIAAIVSGDVSYGNRQDDIDVAAHLTNIESLMKTARDR